ncbi:hypothetical protein EVAR_34433_1 [Eumeta japonica]|uniref:Uncharacterized protein n=1 Tax=Eumeta variegata TaxID=151549 RepID=A0A4C1WN48_EUMVA|nr:hypothetical protein EVAR_34433_1 [Eumeta japonica]
MLSLRRTHRNGPSVTIRKKPRLPTGVTGNSGTVHSSFSMPLEKLNKRFAKLIINIHQRDQKTAVAVASSDIAATLLNGSRSAYTT